MPMRNLISIVIAVAICGHTFVIETLNKHSTTLELMSKDLKLTQNLNKISKR